MKRLYWLAAAVGLLLGATGSARAGLVYDNGPTVANEYSYFIDLGFVVSDSFTVSSATTLTSAQVGIWVPQGFTPLGLAWAIGTSAFANDVAFGTSPYTSLTPISSAFAASYGYDVYDATFALNGNVAPANTYWLTLSNGADTAGGETAWDQNSGPSAAEHNTKGSIPSEAFRLFDAGASATPEPASLTLLSLGALSLGGYAWRRRRAIARAA